MLKKIDNNIWVTEQPFKYWGLDVGTRMTVVRLLTGELVVISPISIYENTVSQLNEIGRVGYIIAPNLYHHLFLMEFQKIYARAQIWVPLGFDLKLPNIAVDKVISDTSGNFFEEIDYLLVDGFKVLELSGAATLNEFVFFHRDSQTLIITDTAFNFDGKFNWKTQLAARLLGIYGKLRPSPLEKLASQEKNQVMGSIKKILQWDFDRVILAHGSIVELDGKKLFKEGFEEFFGCCI